MKTTYTAPVERGILTSAYKWEIKTEIRHSHLETLSHMRDVITDNCVSRAGTILQVSIFAIVLILLTF